MVAIPKMASLFIVLTTWIWDFDGFVHGKNPPVSTNISELEVLLGFVIKNDEKSGVDHHWKWMEMVDAFGAGFCW